MCEDCCLLAASLHCTMSESFVAISTSTSDAAPMLHTRGLPVSVLLLTAVPLFAGPQWQSLQLSNDQYRLLSIDGRTDILRVVDNKLQRLDGRTLLEVWKRGMTSTDQPTLRQLKEGDGFDPTGTLRYIRHVSRQCPDLNGDRQGDLIVGLDYQADLAAVSGKDGGILWWFRTHARPLTEVENDEGDSFVLAEPTLLDVDGDGTLDVLAGFACARQHFKRDDRKEQHPQQTLIQAVSGKTGKLLWKHEL